MRVRWYNRIMDEYVKQSIDTRKQAMSATYKVDAAMQKIIDKLFGEIEKLGAKCNDVGEFESKFAASSLNQQYLDLFTEVATNSQVNAAAPKVSKAGIGKTMTGKAALGIAESVAGQVLDDVVPTRAAVHQKVSDVTRNIPVVGDAIDIGQKASYAAHLGKVFGKRKKKD